MTKPRGRPPHDDLLTPAEWRTVNRVRHGLTNQQIADQHNISLDAVKFHVANAIAKLGLPNRGALKRWHGAHKHSPLQQEHHSMNTTPLGDLGQIARSVSDVDTSAAFFTDVVGLPLLFRFDRLAFFDCGGTRLMLELADDGATSESVLYFRVDDIEASFEHLNAAGAEFVAAPHLIHTHPDGTEEWMAFFNDPDGRPLAIMSSVAA